VFRGVYGVLNTVGLMEGVIFIPKKGILGKGVNVFRGI
jgi:hypothetical protein